MEAFVILVSGFVLFVLISNYLENRKTKKLRLDRAVNGDFREENANKMVASILTGIPVKTRYGDGGLTPAGGQQLAWCNQILKDMGNKKSIMVQTMWGKQKMTRKEVIKHKNSI